MPPKRTIAGILAASDSGLQALFSRANRLHALSQTLQQALGEPLGAHVALVNLRDDTAIVAADSSAWLIQLRYQAPMVLNILRQQTGLESLRKVQIKVQPISAPPEAPPARRASLSQRSAETLASAATGIDDPALADALRRLARRNKGND